jgi:hypothetical protein
MLAVVSVAKRVPPLTNASLEVPLHAVYNSAITNKEHKLEHLLVSRSSLSLSQNFA